MILRPVAAIAVLVSAWVHLWMWFHGVRDQGVVGWLFLLNVVGGVAIAYLLVRRRHWLPLLLAVGFGASTLGAFTVAATVGLFGVHTHWSGGYVWTAFAAEVLAIVTGLAAAWREGYLAYDGLHRAGSGRRPPIRTASGPSGA